VDKIGSRMSTSTRPRAHYDTAKMVRDMALKGWLPTDLARSANVSDMTVSRFLKGDTQTERVADKLARALGYSPRRYLLQVKAANQKASAQPGPETRRATTRTPAQRRDSSARLQSRRAETRA
jgi:plasmid maintenance system antidote protein VapI